MTDARTVVLTGIGLVVEDVTRGGWQALNRELVGLGLERLSTSFVANGNVRRRDDKLLSKEDLIAVQAAERAMQDAFGARAPRDRQWGCVSFTTSKLTRDNELTAPFVRYRKPDNAPDTIAFRRAIDAAEIQIDPLGLLRRLDNTVCWWLCKTYGFGDLNLQIGQCLDPDFWALVSAIDLVASGDCECVIVGGGETIEQSAVQLSALRDGPCGEADPSVAGGALFFVLESEASAQGRRAYARWSVDLLGELSGSAARHDSHASGTPALTTALGVLRSSLGANGDALPIAGTGPIRVESLPQ